MHYQAMVVYFDFLIGLDKLEEFLLSLQEIADASYILLPEPVVNNIYTQCPTIIRLLQILTKTALQGNLIIFIPTKLMLYFLSKNGKKATISFLIS